MKATLLVLLLSVVAVMVTCDHQQSEQAAGPGCPLGKRLAFDLDTTLEESKRLNNEYFDCPNPEPGTPCFYYSHVFYPFFVIEDTVVGESGRFLDSYTFKVVGGGRTRGSVQNYSREEILRFNSLTDSESSQQTLVWTYDDGPDSLPLTKEGFVVMRGASNRVRWLCQRNSPCGDLTPRNLLDPDFFFIIEVSNKETASSPFCEHNLRFELHVHGFPLDPVRGLFFLQMTMTAVHIILICSAGHTCWRLRRKSLHTKKRDGLDEQVLVDNFQLTIRRKRHCKSQKSPDVKEGETQSGERAVEDLEMSQTEIQEEFHKEAVRHASSDSKHSKRKIELINRHLQLLAAMDHHMQRYRSQACLLDKLVETFFTDQDEETRSVGIE
ncbi:hypothetical protein SRHO_G00333990 [Serrasalmus rhombeus]